MGMDSKRKQKTDSDASSDVADEFSAPCKELIQRLQDQIENSQSALKTALEQVDNLQRSDKEKDLKLKKLEGVADENKFLKRENKALKRKLYGSKAEGLKTVQMPLFDQTETALTTQNSLNEEGREKLEKTVKRVKELKELIKDAKKDLPKAPRKSKKLADSDVETRREDPIEPESTHCDACDIEKIKIGEDETYDYHWIPGRFVKVLRSLPKYLCPECRDYSDVSQALVPVKPIPRSPVTASLLAKIIVDKYAYGLPFDRQTRIFASFGFLVSVTTLCSWTRQISWLFELIADMIQIETFQSDLVQFDESRIKVRNLSLEKNLRRSHMWFYCGPTGAIYCKITDSNGGEHAEEVFGEFEGHFQCDGASTFDRLDTSTRTRLGCWAHARRKFEADSKLNDQQSLLALFMIKKIYKLHWFVSLGFSQYSEELSESVDEYFNYVNELKSKLTRSDLGYVGATYSKNQEKALRNCFLESHFKLDNNRSEQQVKTLGQGRRNWYFVGSQEMTKTCAAIYSVILSCLELNLNVYEYIEDLIDNCPKAPKREAHQWTPIEWAKRRKSRPTPSTDSTKSTTEQHLACANA